MERTRIDLRVDLILRVQNDHMVSSAGTKDCSQGEHWRCRCGEKYLGNGAIQSGRRHVATETLAALDMAAMVP
jgi:hypothetical protein